MQGKLPWSLQPCNQTKAWPRTIHSSLDRETSMSCFVLAIMIRTVVEVNSLFGFVLSYFFDLNIRASDSSHSQQVSLTELLQRDVPEHSRLNRSCRR